MHDVYLIESLARPDQRYVGITSDLKARLLGTMPENRLTLRNSSLGGS